MSNEGALDPTPVESHSQLGILTPTHPSTQLIKDEANALVSSAIEDAMTSSTYRDDVAHIHNILGTNTSPSSSPTPQTLCSSAGVSICPTRPYSLSLGSLGPPPLSGAPPSYSVAMAGKPIIQQPSPPFVAPGPPPSYAVAHGLYMDFPIAILQTNSSSSATHWSPRPLPVVCPRCGALVVTNISSHRTVITHVTALGLFLCGCWPCCLLPYCMDACKNTHHTCPACQHYLGTYTPW